MQMASQIKRIWGQFVVLIFVTEIIEYTAQDEVAVCNLASLALPKFISKWQI